jgi:hypothetical protein
MSDRRNQRRYVGRVTGEHGMTNRRMTTAMVAAAATVVGFAVAGHAQAAAGRPATAASTTAMAAATGSCRSGAHTLSKYGDHVYPETGNGGYTSLHTDVHLVYDAVTDRFLPGNHVVLADRATTCLRDFSLDFERSSPFAGGPDLSVATVTVNGRRARYQFVQPTYPGDPHGQNDPDPRAHQAGQNAVVGGPSHNPLPPACSPELGPEQSADALDGTPCPANKLVIRPAAPIRAGATFSVTVAYTGRPGVHQDGDGTTDGWFRSNDPVGDGGFVITEPAGSEDWMPLNNHPSAKPTYDFYDRVTAGRTAVANGVLVGHHTIAADALFPHGSTFWHWHMASPVASYLVENSVGNYDLRSRVVRGVRYYEVVPSSLTQARKAEVLAIMDRQPDITRFEAGFNGAYPFSSAGVLLGLPDAGFDEEMEGMITFAAGVIDTGTLYHENMHQWWGDHVSEANYNDAFLKEGMATLGESLYGARTAAQAVGGLGTQAGRTAFESSLVTQFDHAYTHDAIWSGIPSDPTAYTLFSGSSTYERPGLAYLALRRILGPARFAATLRWMQQRYGNATITEPQLEAAFGAHLPSRAAACRVLLGTFFTQWFDTKYPTAAGATQPSITGPGLAGAGFWGRGGNCA